MSIQDLYDIFLDYPKVFTDTRSIDSKGIFFALGGPRFNGNHFAAEALEKGCVFAIVDEEVDSSNERIIIVDNVLKTLQDLAKYHRTQFDIPIICITGSNGKTTTKELVVSVLQKKYKVIGTKGNLNNHIGVPLSLLDICNDTEIAVIELGTNAPGEISFLCNIAKPTHGLITSVGIAHTEGLIDLAGIIREKSYLYHYISTNNGIIFHNTSNIQLVKSLHKAYEIIEFSKQASLKSYFHISSSYPRLIANIVCGKFKFNLNVLLYGDYNFNNIAASICIGEYFEIATNLIVKALNDYVPSNNRTQTLMYNASSIFLDAYNANPTSMELAIHAFAQSKLSNRILVLGEMKELGISASIEHRRILSLCKSFEWKKVLLFGKLYNIDLLPSNYKCYDSIRNLKIEFDTLSFGKCHFLIKGSRSMRLERLLVN